MTKIALMSDTHGFLSPKLKEKLKDFDLVLHAGDLGDKKILEELKKINKVIAVYGNVDELSLNSILKEEETLEIKGLKIHLSHQKQVHENNYDIIVRGHTHVLEVKKESNTLFLNPGSCNPEKSTPVNTPSFLKLTIDNKNSVSVEAIFI